MKVTFFGTGFAQSTKYYNTCYLLEENSFKLLVDAGGGNQIINKLNEHNINLLELHHLFVTHEHIDHLLGVFWIIRYINTLCNKGVYNGIFYIYASGPLIKKIRDISMMTLNKLYSFDKQIIFVEIEDKKQIVVDEHKLTFFDICSSKALQFGLTIEYNNNLTSILGDEPYHDHLFELVKNSDIMFHEAFCLDCDANSFNPYEKSHGTLEDACKTAEALKVKNLIIYHTEDKTYNKRKELYYLASKSIFTGNIFIPDDDEVIYF